MRFVLFYGPPAAGKLTTAQALSELTGIPVFHNHITIDFAKTLGLDFDAPLFWELVDQTRLNTLKFAAQNGISLILTYVFAAGDDEPYIYQVKHLVESQGGQMDFVRLHCPEPELHARIGNPSRKALGKLTDGDILKQLMSEKDFLHKISGVDSLEFDTTQSTPEETARQVAEKLELLQVTL
ncbi:AAA family ATPase [Deinococcus roseus]|uniref:Shikimate kinase n=1 Tax=Deinococcus roseus TaxID=392414 RepID=A0ABQ2D8L7_9DEIO|nr:hypothetical protein [Deinococcus roseus]GGJ49449.1 hypothetical protein GCM10008938_39290 [Deinococcus roseus]